MDDDQLLFLRLVALPGLVAGVVGVFDPFLSLLFVGIGIGLVLVLASVALEEWHDFRERRRTVVPAPGDVAPLRTRVKEWGEAIDVWSKVALRFTGVGILVFSASGAAGALARKLGAGVELLMPGIALPS